jgi:hypothetical protein
VLELIAGFIELVVTSVVYAVSLFIEGVLFLVRRVIVPLYDRCVDRSAARYHEKARGSSPKSAPADDSSTIESHDKT